MKLATLKNQTRDGLLVVVNRAMTHCIAVPNIADTMHDGFLAASEVDEVTQAYLATRFGGSPLPPSEYHRLRHLSRTVRQGQGRRPTA